MRKFIFPILGIIFMISFVLTPMFLCGTLPNNKLWVPMILPSNEMWIPTLISFIVLILSGLGILWERINS